MYMIENFQRFVKTTVEEFGDDKEVLHQSLDELMMDTLDELGVDITSIRNALKGCWYA